MFLKILEGNNITAKGAEAIAGALKFSILLKELYIGNYYLI